MQIGIVGLGRMGGNMARRLARGGVARHRLRPRRRDAGGARARKARSAPPRRSTALVAALPAPRVVWLMVPAGEPTTTTALDDLAARLAPGDLVVDGGNANYKDSQRRAAELAARGLQFADCGVSAAASGASTTATR